jgi:dihydrofolate synthase/folylpolyglutamate synthase
MLGRHQFENAGVAIATLRAVGDLKLPPDAFETGIGKAEWPARMQRLSQGPLIGLLPAGSELWLDGGHNADGGRAIANALADLEERVSRPLVLVVGMLESKDCVGFLKSFTGLARRVVAVTIPGQEKAQPAASIASAARGVGMPAQAGGGIEAALAAVGALGLDPPPRVLITGSLYLAGAVLAANGTPPE